MRGAEVEFPPLIFTTAGDGDGLAFDEVAIGVAVDREASLGAICVGADLSGGTFEGDIGVGTEDLDFGEGEEVVAVADEIDAEVASGDGFGVVWNPFGADLGEDEVTIGVSGAVFRKAGVGESFDAESFDGAFCQGEFDFGGGCFFRGFRSKDAGVGGDFEGGIGLSFGE